MSLYKKPKPKRNTLIKEDDIDYVSSDSESDPEYPLEPKNNPEARILGPVYFPFKEGVLFRTAVSDRQENPVVFMDISAVGGRRLRTGEITKFRLLGRLHFELRKDLVPMTCQNFMGLITGFKGVGKDGVRYCYKGRYLHRIVRGQFFQGGDLLDEKGNCSKSALNEGYFADENFIFRHTGPGCLSMSNKGPDSNGSIFQVTFQQMPEMDERYVVFGCLASTESYFTLDKISHYATPSGAPIEDLKITNCGIAYPDPEVAKAKVAKAQEKALEKLKKVSRLGSRLDSSTES